MKAVSDEQLQSMLKEAVHSERQGWKPLLLTRDTRYENHVMPQKYETSMCWILELSHKFHCYPECFCLATSLLDKFLHTVKIQPKHLHCAAVACFFIATKMTEEAEEAPKLDHIVQLMHCISQGTSSLSAADLIRMEAIILDKLSWNVNPVTALQFLHIFHAMLMRRPLVRSVNPPTASESPKSRVRQECYGSATLARQLATATAKLMRFLCQAEARVLRPSVIALSLLSLELTMAAPWQRHHRWLTATMWLRAGSQITMEELVQGRELVAGALYEPSEIPSNILCKRKRYSHAEDFCHTDDVYDSIKQLYKEEA